MWTYEYDSDFGSDNDGFWERYNLKRDGKPVGTINDWNDAILICDRMNAAEAPPESAKDSS